MNSELNYLWIRNQHVEVDEQKRILKLLTIRNMRKNVERFSKRKKINITKTKVIQDIKIVDKLKDMPEKGNSWK